jgi:hypothetical protein
MLPCLERLGRGFQQMFGCFHGVATKWLPRRSRRPSLLRSFHAPVSPRPICMRTVPGASGDIGISIAGAKRSRSLWMSHAKIWICPASTNITDVPSSTQPGSHNDHQCICNAVGGNLAVGSGSSRTSLPNGCGTPQWMEFYIAGGKVEVEVLVKLDLRRRRPCLSLGTG